MMAWLNTHLTFEQQRLLLICSSVLIVTAITMYLLLPAYRAHVAISQQIQGVQAQLRSTTIPAAELSRLQTDIKGFSQQIQSRQVSTNESEAESELLRHLHITALQQDLQLTRIQPQQGQATAQVRELRFEIEVVGAYADTARWLELLDSAEHNTVLHNFEIGSVDDSGHALRTKVTVLAYQVVAA